MTLAAALGLALSVPVQAATGASATSPAVVSPNSMAAANAVPAGTDAPAGALPNIAFFYSDPSPVVTLLQAYDAVVVSPSSTFKPTEHALEHTTWIARVDLANVAADTTNLSGSFVEQTLAPLWQQGYRGFAFDGLDALFASAPNADARATREHNVATLIDTAAQRFQNARIVQHGGASLLPQTHPRVYAYVTGSVMRGLDANGQTPVPVPEAQRAATLADAQRIHQDFQVPVIAIDFCPALDRACARDDAKAVRAVGDSIGLAPYVTDPGFDSVGIGRIEVIPRRILLVQDTDPTQPIDESAGVRDLAMPLNYLGYTIEYADVNKPLPGHVTPDRYAGIVVWLERAPVDSSGDWEKWILARIADHVRTVFFSDFGFVMNPQAGAALGLTTFDGRPRGQVSIVSKDPMIGFEVMPAADGRDADGIKVGDNGTSLLRLAAGDFVYDPVALTPWGGYALSPFTIASLNSIGQERWAIQPLDFLSRALALKPMPMPDTTTENGHRFFMVHVDGDGFASRCEFPGPDFSGQALYDRLFSKYRVPTTLSVIEGEVGSKGLYPQLSPRLEQIARQMFLLPNVEIGTHTYSHPFEWEDVQEGTGERVKHRSTIDQGGGDSAFSLNIPNYTFNLDREITGSIDYINSRLAPPGKKVKILQWSGNCEPPGIAVRKTYEAGVLNINGGDTVITKTANSWTNIAPIGVDKGPDAFQVYAPNQDENVYTDDWQGPFYGFTRVLETYAMTNEPRRFKPINLYFHMYSGTKIASLRALEEIYQSVLKQSVFPIFASEYALKAIDWQNFAVARDGDSWLVRGDGELRELRYPSAVKPNLASSSNVAGFTPAPDGTYIHMAGSSARFSLATGDVTQPYVKAASGFIRKMVRGPGTLNFEVGSYYQPSLDLANVGACRVNLDGKAVARRGDDLHLDLTAVTGQDIQYHQVEVNCGS
ncbi:sugar ABC transporter [Pararobbsia alpina]|uniref:sugar ABC transporter n=1 Tax=Pararobbsia alpina TaxID=621374 RepID=UPI00158393F0|nr:sugar ABC transporter [Pararobbsia alpina]